MRDSIKKWLIKNGFGPKEEVSIPKEEPVIFDVVDYVEDVSYELHGFDALENANFYKAVSEKHDIEKKDEFRQQIMKKIERAAECGGRYTSIAFQVWMDKDFRDTIVEELQAKGFTVEDSPSYDVMTDIRISW